jgi:hypothetical protein
LEMFNATRGLDLDLDVAQVPCSATIDVSLPRCR